MQLEMDADLIEALVKAGAKSPVLKGDEGYWRKQTFHHHHLLPADLKLLRKVLATAPFARHPHTRKLITRLNAVDQTEKLGNNREVKRLEVLADVLRGVLSEAPRKWVFRQDRGNSGATLPWFVTDVSYHPSRGQGKDYEPAYTEIVLEAMSRGSRERQRVAYYNEDLPITAGQALLQQGVFPATDKTVEDYDRGHAYYKEHAKRTGAQFLAVGAAAQAYGKHDDEDDATGWRRSEVTLEVDGVASRVVMDDTVGRGKDDGIANTAFWLGKRGGEEEEVEEEDADDEDEETTAQAKKHREQESASRRAAADRFRIEPGKVTMLPVHPVVRVFSLQAHVYVDVHMHNLTPYVSQLGTDETSLEKRLTRVLERATRWGAILLIDEADVYIHERGDSIQQNAIVGVFLRLLEYYTGILFLTTNRATVVDDAIMSRTTAHVRYHHPVGDARNRLWRILFEQYKVKTTDIDLLAEEAVEAFPNVSGRTMRQLIRLGLFLAGPESGKFTIDTLKKVAEFNDATRTGDE